MMILHCVGFTRGGEQLKGQFPVGLMSRVFDVGKSGYYAGLKRGSSKRSQDNARLEVAIKAAHVRTRQSYGPERLRDERAADGFPSGVGRIKRLRKKLEICCKQKRKFKATTSASIWPPRNRTRKTHCNAPWSTAPCATGRVMTVPTPPCCNSRWCATPTGRYAKPP